MRTNWTEMVTQISKSALLFLITVCIVYLKTVKSCFWAQSECLVYNSLEKKKIRKDRNSQLLGVVWRSEEINP